MEQVVKSVGGRAKIYVVELSIPVSPIGETLGRAVTGAAMRASW